MFGDKLEVIMEFGGFQKLTVLDYPEHVACILFTKGCNFRCPFCHNAVLVENKTEETYSEEEILSFLNKRKGVLDGVDITGGEPLMHKDIGDFLKKVKALGYDIKIDTNGCYPERLKKLVGEGLVDYVAMDIKNTPEKYAMTAGVKVPLEKIEESIDFLMSDAVDYEFRTTVTKEFHTPQDIEKIAKRISGAKRYFIQNFIDSGNILGADLSPVLGEILAEMTTLSQRFVENAKNR